MQDSNKPVGSSGLTSGPDAQLARPTHVRWMVLALLALAAASAYLTRHGIAAANTSIQQDLNLNDAQMGQILGAFAIGYTLFQIPGGWLGNRLGSRRALALLSVAWSLCNVATALAFRSLPLWGSRLSLGVFQAGMVPISAKIVKDWIPTRHRGISSACISASMSLGGALALALTGWLLSRGYPWRMIFYAYSTVGIVWAAAFYLLFRSRPQDHHRVNLAELQLIEQDESTKDESTKDESTGREARSRFPLAAMLSSPSMWGICIQAFFRNAGYTFFVTWFFAFLEYRYGIEKEAAGLLNSLPLIAVVIGSLAGGVVIDRLWRITGSKWISRSGTAITTLLVCGAFTLAAAWAQNATQLTVMIAVGALFAGMGNPATWTTTIDIGGPQTSVVMGAMNSVGSLAGVILPVVLGAWFEQIRETNGNWNDVIYLHAAFYFLAALSWLMINPNRCVVR